MNPAVMTLDEFLRTFGDELSGLIVGAWGTGHADAIPRLSPDQTAEEYRRLRERLGRARDLQTRMYHAIAGKSATSPAPKLATPDKRTA